MIINCKKAEMLEESDLLLPLTNQIKLNSGYLDLEQIPHIRRDNCTIYYLQQGMNLYLIKNDFYQKVMYVYVIEQTVTNGKMAIKDIYTSTSVENDFAEFYKYDRAFERKNISDKLTELLESLPFVMDAGYMKNKINEYLEKNDTVDELSKYILSNGNITHVEDLTPRQRASIENGKKGGRPPKKIEQRSGRGGNRESITLEVDGVTYKSLYELSKAYNVSYNNLYKHYAKGRDLKEILNNKTVEITKKGINLLEYEYKGKIYNTIKDIAKEAGVKYEPLWERLKKGMSPDEAVQDMLNKNLTALPRKTYKYAGEEVTLNQLSELSGIPEQTIWNRINRSGQTVEEAIEA